MSTTFKNIVNRFNTTIKAASSINNTDDPVTFNITDATGIPAVPFYFTVEQLTDSSVFERMLATAVDADEIIATRAQDGSSKQAFAAGDLVQIRVMAAHINEVTVAINTLEDGTALLAGRVGGQTLIGGTASGEDLILQSTVHATKGKIYFGIAQTSYFDETTESLVITGTLNTHTIPGGTGTIALTTDITGTNSGTNTGDQTSIVGISGTIAEFNTALSDGSFATGGGTATGSNTGDQDLSGKANVDQTMYIGTTGVAINRTSAALTLAGITLTTPNLGTPSTLVGTNISGTAASLTAGKATILATARTIGGVSFNGSANINLPGVNTAGNQNTSGTSGGTVANAVTLAMMAHGTDGNLITYNSAGAPAYVVTGDNDQVLTSNGAGAAPTFQDAAGGALAIEATVADFQKNPGTGTMNYPDGINDGDITTTGKSSANETNQYIIVDYGELRIIRRWRQHGSDYINGDGSWKIQYYNLSTHAWVDWVTGIATRTLSWSNFATETEVITNKIKLVCTGLDSYGINTTIHELEVIY